MTRRPSSGSSCGRLRRGTTAYPTYGSDGVITEEDLRAQRGKLKTQIAELRWQLPATSGHRSRALRAVATADDVRRSQGAASPDRGQRGRIADASRAHDAIGAASNRDRTRGTQRMKVPKVPATRAGRWRRDPKTRTHAAFGKYVVFPSPEAHDAVVLWCPCDPRPAGLGARAPAGPDIAGETLRQVQSARRRREHLLPTGNSEVTTGCQREVTGSRRFAQGHDAVLKSLLNPRRHR